MAYNKVYENKPIWHNDREPAINETRLNALSGAVDIIDDRVIELDEKPLNDMSNVDITNLQNGQGIKWNATTQKWENGIVGGSPIMTWAEYQEKWEAGEIEPLTVVTISDLSDAFVNLVALTWAEYQHLIELELDDDNILYAITDRSAGLDLINDNVISEVQSWSSSKVNSTLSPTLTKEGLTFSACEYVRGGYAIIGKLVFVELRVKTTSSIPAWGSILGGLPTSGNNEVPLNAVNTNNATLLPCDVFATNIRANTNITSGVTLNLSGMYITQ